MYKRIFLSATLLLGAAACLSAQGGRTFEMRWFTRDARADGVTDFHGETEWFDTDTRVDALNRYAAYGSRFWGDPQQDTPLFSEEEVGARLAAVKPQPLPSVRHQLVLDDWRSIGYKAGKEAAVAARWKAWTAGGGRIADGALQLDAGASVNLPVSPMDWRFRLRATLREPAGGLTVRLEDSAGHGVDIPVGDLSSFEIYADLSGGRIFLSSEGRTVRETAAAGLQRVTALRITALSGRALIDGTALYAFVRQEDKPTQPYRTEMRFDEDFDAVPSMKGWQDPAYDDALWHPVRLPAPLGGERAAGESFYLRTKVSVGTFCKAILRMETLDPAGEVWVNGTPAAVLRGRIPREIDITEYLLEGCENTIAVRVKPFQAKESVFHAPSDKHVGWFLGRTQLVLTDTPDRIAECLVHTQALSENEALQHHRIVLRNDTGFSRKGSLILRYAPWFPSEGACVSEVEQAVELRPRVDNPVDMDLRIPSPRLWNPSTPQLYKVEVVLKDEDGRVVDDFVTTTGIRLIEQRQGVLYVNGQPEVLGGGQNFGYRMPVENAAVTIRCATDAMVMRELMMSKAMGNLLRIHVQSQMHESDGINDPRFAEYADQLGLFLIWQTAGWIREGEVWNVDIADFPAYMRRVYNHPSIVMWEASNHPNRFRQHDASDSQDYIRSIVSTITRLDSSRLVSPTSFWQHMHFATYDGSVDDKGNPLAPDPWLMHRMMTRGSQDSYAGYTHTWSELRKIPYPFAKSCLDAKDLCYFNFEHEESIGQPNWALARKEPWFEIFSYERDYEKASIGRFLEADEWKASQAYQAFSAWESMKMQLLCGVSGFSWCSLESGPNMFTYEKPVVDPFCVPKLAFHANRMAFQRTWAGSDDVDTVYGPGDEIRPVIFNLDGAHRVTLEVELQNEKGRTLERKVFKDVEVAAGRSVTRLAPFRFRNRSEGCRFIVYTLR